LRLSAAAGRRSHNGGGRSGFRGGGGGAKETAAEAAAEARRGRRGGRAGKVLLETVHDGVRDGLRGARQTRRRPSVSELLRPVNNIIRVQYNIIPRYKILYVIVVIAVYRTRCIKYCHLHYYTATTLFYCTYCR